MRLFKSKVERLAQKQNSSGLIKALHEQDPRIRAEAARAVSPLTDPLLLPALIAALADTDKVVRYEAVRALGNRRNVSLLGLLLPLLNDPELPVRSQALEAISNLGKGGVGPLLVALQVHKNAVICQGIVRALGDIGPDEEVLRVFIGLLDDPRHAVRYAAAAQLEKVGVVALPLLVDALQHEEAEVRFHVCEIILGICADSPGPSLIIEQLFTLLLEG